MTSKVFYLNVLSSDISSLEQLLLSLLLSQLNSLFFPASSHLIAVQSSILVPGFVCVAGTLRPGSVHPNLLVCLETVIWNSDEEIKI
jgi:hypothetical protein